MWCVYLRQTTGSGDAIGVVACLSVFQSFHLPIQCLSISQTCVSIEQEWRHSLG